MRMLDLFCGRWGWSKAFAARGWECIGVDLVEPTDAPKGCRFIRADILELSARIALVHKVDFICASSPCEQFSVHRMKHFHPNPPYPELGIKLFEHTRRICEESGVPYVMENVRAAQKFVGNAVHHCGPFYLWGTGVPLIIPKGITKGCKWGGGVVQKQMSIEERREHRKKFPAIQSSYGSRERDEFTAKWATIPPELAGCVADYAARICEQKGPGVMGNVVGI